jgi:hypothetical protein
MSQTFDEKEKAMFQKQKQRIAVMQKKELLDFGIEISMSDLDRNQRNELYDAIAQRIAEIENAHDVMVEVADFD